MGSFINRLLKDEPAFSAEFNNYIQEIKLENNEEIINLHSTINSLRQQLEEISFRLISQFKKRYCKKRGNQTTTTYYFRAKIFAK